MEEIAPTLGTLEEESTWIFSGVGHGHDQRSVAEAFDLVERQSMIKAVELTFDRVQVVLHFVFFVWVGTLVNATAHETTLDGTLVVFP